MFALGWYFDWGGYKPNGQFDWNISTWNTPGKKPLTLWCVKCQIKKNPTSWFGSLDIDLNVFLWVKRTIWVPELLVNVGGREYEVIPHVLLCCGIWSFLCSVHMVSTWPKLSYLTLLFPVFSFLVSSLLLLSLCFPFSSPSAPVSISSCVIVTAAPSHLAHFVDL